MMMKTVLTLLLSIVFMTSAIAQPIEAVQTEMADKQKPVVLSEEFVETACSLAEDTLLSTMMEMIEEEGYKIEDIYLDINCAKVGFKGPTLMHLLLKGKPLLVYTALELTSRLILARKKNPSLDTGKFFNMKISYRLKHYTVLEMIDRKIKTLESNKEKNFYYQFAQLRDFLEEKLDAERDPKNLVICEPDVSIANCRYLHPK